VHYLGVVPLPDLYDYTRSADVGIFVPDDGNAIHTHSGAAIVKLNDYLACGIPFVVSHIPAVEQFAMESGAGMAVNIDDPQGTGAAISRLLLNPTIRAAMAESGYKMHCRKYNLETQYAPVLDLVRRLCFDEEIDHKAVVSGSLPG
jgi:glycosyltransferase involved in cell wall biosynthesis